MRKIGIADYVRDLGDIHNNMYRWMIYSYDRTIVDCIYVCMFVYAVFDTLIQLSSWTLVSPWYL